MLELALWILIILLCVFLEGFFSGTETAMVSLDRARVKARAEQGSKGEAKVIAALHSPEKFFSTTLLGTNIFEVLSNAIATFLVISYLGVDYKYLTILIMTPVILVLGEIAPKTIYRYHAESITPYLVYPLKVMSIVFYPVVAALTGVTALFVKLFGIEGARLKPHTTREDLENYLRMWNLDSGLRTAEKKIVERIFDFTETEVEDIMIPLINVAALEIGDGMDQAIRLAQKTGYSRIPVYSEEAYNIMGIVHAFDLLTARARAQSLRDIMRQAPYVPNTAPVDELLRQLRTEGNSIAVVVNEYGGTIGIVTLEDILEEVVGEIYDEYDKEEHFFVQTGRNRYLVNARMEIDELNDHLRLELPKDDYETVAGFLLKHMERIPRVGERFQFENMAFAITKADRRSIKEVSITIADAPEKEGGGTE
ncbi:MAG: HlyC/CorC family transporter [Deltaproteobacteria bacterium]|nr:HlyC/CorC family transporter [Deltaproteobacteria bacterium]MBW2079033.1 HlyC/CorC family transporter [Deltaproteobacteria bacterium]MBW2312251.1 HlyC/CorC family transporter [Deltaproteobacteria bacterium]